MRKLVRQRLRQHRLNDTIIDDALNVADQHSADGELLAACRFAKRRRLGPFDDRLCDDEKDRQVVRQRQLGSLARAGFAMAVSRAVIRLENRDAAEMLMDQLEQGEDPTA